MRVLKKGDTGEDVKKIQQVLGITPDGIFGINTETSVRLFQLNNGLSVDGIVGPMTLKKMGINPREIDEIIIHCSATPEQKEYTVNDIDKWHRERGFNKIGYHYVIYLDGSIHTGRDESEIGAHCTNHNSKSIGVCYIGGLDKNGNPKDTRTPEQKNAIIKLLKDLKQKYPNSTIHSHSDFANKACPCFNATNEYRNI